MDGVGAASAGDAGRADQIVPTLRQVLAKYKDYLVDKGDGYAQLHPERTPKLIISPISSAAL